MDSNITSAVAKVTIPVLGHGWAYFRSWRKHQYHRRHRRIAFDTLYEFTDKQVTTLRDIWLQVAVHDPQLIRGLWEHGLVTRPFIKRCKGIEVGTIMFNTKQVGWVERSETHRMQ